MNSTLRRRVATGLFASCLILGSTFRMFSAQADDYSGGWKLDPAEDPLFDTFDDDDGSGDDDDDTLYYYNVNTGRQEVYQGRADEVSATVITSQEEYEAGLEKTVTEIEEIDEIKPHHHQKERAPKRTSRPKPKKPASKGGVGKSTPAPAATPIPEPAEGT